MYTSRERTDAFADQGGLAFRRFQLACIRSGNDSVLQREMRAQSHVETLRKLFCDDYANALLSLNFVWAQAWDAAVDAGLPEKKADAIYQKWFTSANSKRSVEHLITCHIEIMVEYAAAVQHDLNRLAYSPFVKKVCHYVETHVYEALRVQDISENLFISPSRLSHQFKKETGLPLTTYIQIKKLDVAKLLLLQSHSSVSDVMGKLGFISQSHFTKAFREYTGVTPGQYRTRAQQCRLEEAATTQATLTAENETWFVQAEEYGRQKGIELQNYMLACVRRGKTAPLEDYFQSEMYQKELSALFEGNLEGANISFVYLWPQVAHAAVDSGLELRIAMRIMVGCLSKLYKCQTVYEAMELNKNYILEMTEAVADL